MNAMNIRSLFVAMLLVFAVVAPSPTVSYAEAKQTEGSAFDWLQQDAKQGKQGTGESYLRILQFQKALVFLDMWSKSSFHWQ
ncbi:hypothetical protein ACLMAB_02360 [Brevibacillus laterosporus]